MIRSTIAGRALVPALLGLLGFAPLLAHAEEWRWCAAGDVMDSGPPNGPFRSAEPFRADDLPDFQAQFEAQMRSAMAPIEGELTVICSPAFPDEKSALSHQTDWFISLEGAIPVTTAYWTPERHPVASDTPTDAAASAGKRIDRAASSASDARVATATSAPQPVVDTASSGAEQDRAAAQRAEERRQHYERERIAAQQGGKPLRFVLWVGLQPQVGDSSNPSCYSNVITRPGPAGWGAENLPTGTAEQAIAIIDAAKASFLAKCRATSGREISGIVHHERNQDERDEASLLKVRAIGPQDSTVPMD